MVQCWQDFGAKFKYLKQRLKILFGGKIPIRYFGIIFKNSNDVFLSSIKSVYLSVLFSSVILFLMMVADVSLWSRSRFYATKCIATFLQPNWKRLRFAFQLFRTECVIKKCYIFRSTRQRGKSCWWLSLSFTDFYNSNRMHLCVKTVDVANNRQKGCVLFEDIVPLNKNVKF